jgi:CDP-diglyceride synthetase
MVWLNVWFLSLEFFALESSCIRVNDFLLLHQLDHVVSKMFCKSFLLLYSFVWDNYYIVAGLISLNFSNSEEFKIASNMGTVFFQIPAWVIALVVFLLIFTANWFGFIYRKRLSEKKPEDIPENLGTLEGSLMGLLALMLAFSFGMGATKFEARRSLAVHEANAVGAAILLLDMYPDSVKKEFISDFDKYIDTRMAYYIANFRDEARNAALKETEVIFNRMWKKATYLSRDPEYLVSSQQMIPKMTEMIDLVIERNALREARIPFLVLMMLLLLTLVSAFLSGYSHKARKRNIMMITAFAVMTTFTIYIVLEFDRPQRGFISIDSAQQKIMDQKLLLKHSE